MPLSIFSEPNQIQPAFHLGATGLAALGAVLNGLIALIFYRRSKGRYGSYLKTDGIVSGLVQENSGEGPIIFPVIRYSVEGTAYEVKNSYGKSSWDIKPGDAVQVAYHPANPVVAEIHSLFMQYLLPLFFSAGCLLALITIPVVYLLAK
jgi:hypothetical protein